MKRILAVGVLLLCLMSSQIARSDEKRDAKIKAEMVENYLLWQEAYKFRDAERMISFESPDFTTILLDGDVVSKLYSDITLRDTIGRIKKVYVAQVGIKKLAIEPNRIVVLSSHRYDYDILGINNQLHHISGTHQSRDIWVEYDRVWMLKRTEALNGKILIDGKSYSWKRDN